MFFLENLLQGLYGVDAPRLKWYSTAQKTISDKVEIVSNNRIVLKSVQPDDNEMQVDSAMRIPPIESDIQVSCFL